MTTAAVFRDTLGHYPTGVAVVTGVGVDGEPVGMVIGSFTSISLDPPLVGFAPMKESKTFARLRESATFCVNVLASDQEDVCRAMAVGGANKFDGVAWSPAPGGAPIIDGVVSWIECDWADTYDGGDHFIVLGAVRDLGVARAVPPLLFFQGGYGRFTLPSLMAESAPDIMEAVRLSETIRSEVEACSVELGVQCSVSAKIGGEIVTVLVAQPAGGLETSMVGQRVPHIAPLGSVFLTDALDEEVEDWLRHLGTSDPETVKRLRANLDAVRSRGYSIALTSESSEERRAVMAAYSSPESVPSHARRIRELISSSVEHYEPEIAPEGRYDLYSINIAVPGPSAGPPLSMRIMNLPQRADGATVEGWIATLRRRAQAAGALL